MEIASLILGIISLLITFFTKGTGGLILAGSGIMLGFLGKENEKRKGVAIAGMIFSIMAFVWGAAIMFNYPPSYWKNRYVPLLY